MDLGLRDRVAVITGSSQGIGRAIAHCLASEGAKVTICARHEVGLKKAAEFISSSTGVEVLPVQVDLKKSGNVKQMVMKTIKNFGRIDILVNNTGGPPSMLFQETSERVWREAVDLLLMSAVNCCREVIPYMKKRGWGRIINMASFGAKQPAERLILSNTLRSGILGLTKTLSNELAEHGILVNAVCPGWTWTERVKELAAAQAEKTGKRSEEVIAEWVSQIPLKRLAKPEEIASVVAFLASEKASYITGAVIQVDGGFIKSMI
jgi:3-oxoacyl-[acyl-carrier protein] reductase